MFCSYSYTFTAPALIPMRRRVFNTRVFFGVFMPVWAMSFMLRSTPSFFRTINLIISICSNKQVIRSYAWSVITFVKYKLSFRNSIMRNYIHESVRSLFFAAPCLSSLSITGRVQCFLPDPTPGFGNIFRTGKQLISGGQRHPTTIHIFDGGVK